MCTPLHSAELVMCQGASTGPSENLCFQEARDHLMAWPNQKPGIRQDRGQDRRVHPTTPADGETFLHTLHIRGQPAAEMCLGR